MKTEELTPDLFQRALRLYLEKAYPDGGEPPAAHPDLDVVRTPQDVLGLFRLEERPNPGSEACRAYALRLGNARYPHMKVALLEFLEPDEWVWSVDTHDRAPIDPDSPDWDAWNELRIHNLEVKYRVERAWRESGIQTAKALMGTLPQVEETPGGPLVLVVDDEEGIRAGAVQILTEAGYRTVEAASGYMAIQHFLDRRPDLVLMDYEMPGMDGAQLCAKLREFDRRSRRHTRVLMATAGMVDLSEIGLADGFLVKPYRRTLLLSFVRHQLPGSP
jgi:CheY-like chemotaxis protein